MATLIKASNIEAGAVTAASLENSGVTAAEYGSATAIPVFTVNDKGLITAATNVDVAGVTAFSYDPLIEVLTISTADGGSYDADISSLASQSYVDTAISNLIGGAPAALDTLNELAAAINDDASYASSITTALAGKVDKINITGTTVGSDSAIPSVTFNSQGQITTTSSTSIGGSITGPFNDLGVQYGVNYSGTPKQGSFFFDSLNSKMMVYTGSAWVDAVPAGTGTTTGGGTETSANATFEKFTFTVASSTNTVSGSDDNSNTLYYDVNADVEVWVNGVKQVYGASYDYVATNTSSVNFTQNLIAGDIVDIQVYNLLTNDAFYLKTETYTQSEVNSQLATALGGYVPATGGSFSGSVGIGEATPYKKLEVAGDIQLDADNASLWLKSGATGTSGKVNWTYNTDDTVYASAGIAYDTRTTTGFHIDSGYPITIDASASGGKGISFALGGVDKMFMDGSGNFGIGTTNLSKKLHIDGGIGQQLVINSSNSDPGLNINVSGTTHGWLFVDSTDNNKMDIEGINGVNINGLGGVTIAEFTTGGANLALGRNKYKGTQTHETFKWSYNRFSNANSTTTTATWIEASGSSFVFAPTRSDTKIRIIGDINAGMAWTNPSGTNHGNIIYRIKIVNGVGTFYSSEYIYWGRVDTFTGILEHVANGVLEYHMSIANNNGSNVTISVEYQRNVSAGSGFSRGGINTWGSTSLITVEEYLD